jgi:hypothetical protein
MRKIAFISLVILCIIAGGVFVAVKRSDEFHTPERRQWKNDAITAITKDLENPGYLKDRFGEVPEPMGEFDTSELQWLTEETIVCQDASWLAYRAQTHKNDSKIHDIFIARASDGKWYYSDFHFCKQMMVLESNGQPMSLDEFTWQYFMVEFDGVSAAALNHTWIPNGELRFPNEEGEQASGGIGRQGH